MYQKRSYVIAFETQIMLTVCILMKLKTVCLSEIMKTFCWLGEEVTGQESKEATGERLKEFSEKYYPKAKEKFYWAAQDCMSLDGVPYIGPYSSSTSNLYVATGFNKWGMTSSMVSAMLLSDLVQGKTNPFAEVFSPSRTVLRPQLVVNGFEAAVGLLAPTTKRCPHMAARWNGIPWSTPGIAPATAPALPRTGGW